MLKSSNEPTSRRDQRKDGNTVLSSYTGALLAAGIEPSALGEREKKLFFRLCGLFAANDYSALIEFSENGVRDREIREEHYAEVLKYADDFAEQAHALSGLCEYEKDIRLSEATAKMILRMESEQKDFRRNFISFSERTTHYLNDNSSFIHLTIDRSLLITALDVSGATSEAEKFRADSAPLLSPSVEQIALLFGRLFTAFRDAGEYYNRFALAVAKAAKKEERAAHANLLEQARLFFHDCGNNLSSFFRENAHNAD